MDLATAMAAKAKADFILVSEPNRKKVQTGRWYRDTERDSAIGWTGARPGVTTSGSGEGFTWVLVETMIIYSCYVSPNVSMEAFTHFVHELEHSIRTHAAGKRLLVAGDFNSKSPAWGSAREDTRGEIIKDLMASLGLAALNAPGVNTFTRGASGSVIDITMTREEDVNWVTDWKVWEEEEALSPHRYITFTVGTGVKNKQHRRCRGPVDEGRLRRYLEEAAAGTDPSPEALDAVLDGGYRAATKQMRTPDRGYPYWWSAEIAELREDSVRKRRRMARTRARWDGSPAALEVLRAYKDSKKTLRKAIVRAKRRCWKNLIGELNNDPYGDAYRIATRSLKVIHPPSGLSDVEADRVVDELFPPDPPPLDRRPGDGALGTDIACGSPRGCEEAEERQGPGPRWYPCLSDKGRGRICRRFHRKCAKQSAGGG